MGTTFRLIITGASDGFLNMAIDEALGQSFQESGFRKYAGFIRFYGWSCAWLSCGYFQDPRKIIDENKMQQAGVSLVRRLSGGGLVLHNDEVTYSIMCFDQILKPRRVRESYFQLTAFVRDALRHLGLEAHFAYERGAFLSSAFSHICAYGKEEGDIVVAGKKIGGHAQRRKKHFIFQQGFIPLGKGDYALNHFVQEEYKDKEKQEIASLAEFIEIDAENLRQLLQECLRQNLGVDLDERPLTAEEEERARFLAKNKYSTYGWNYCRETKLP